MRLIIILCSVFVFFFFLKATLALGKTTNTTTTKLWHNNKNDMDHKVILIDVGLIIEDKDWIGKMSYECIKMALSDFYATHHHYKTRLVLHTREYKHHDVVSAAAAGMY